MPRRKLGVNIDHVATIRQARRTTYPDPVTAAAMAEQAGADQITVHLREDRRHIQDRDVHLLRQTVQTLLNLEMAATDEMVKIALDVKPDIVTLVPEKRQEVTTEGGLDVCGNEAALKDRVAKLRDGGIEVSMFIDPDLEQVRGSQRLHAHTVELHTGCYCEAPLPKRQAEHKRLADAARFAAQQHMKVAAGHGIHYHNVAELIRIEDIVEYNIGHSIVAQAVMVGFDRAVRDMLAALTL